VIDCGAHLFTAKCKAVISDGWKAIEKAFKASLREKPEIDDNKEDCALPPLEEGQAFENVAIAIKEGTTTPPKHHTEDTLLSGMENACPDDIGAEQERRGLGTPATRAGVIEKLIKSGFIERKKKNIIACDKGRSLIAVLPDGLKSPRLTSEWEHRLMQIQKGELAENEFMGEINGFITKIVKENKAPDPEHICLFPRNNQRTVSLGKCPRCGHSVREAPKSFSCDMYKACGFVLWKESKFWTSKRAALTADIVSALLKHGRIKISGFYSEKSGKTYNATVILDDTGGKYVNFKMEFDRR
jgi:DNA topoisomerase-3